MLITDITKDLIIKKKKGNCNRYNKMERLKQLV